MRFSVFGSLFDKIKHIVYRLLGIVTGDSRFYVSEELLVVLNSL
jgi:hypothetical protein